MAEKELSLTEFREFLGRFSPGRPSGHSTRTWNVLARELKVEGPSDKWHEAKFTPTSIRKVLDRNRTDPNFKWMEGQGDVRGMGKQAQRDLIAFLEKR